MRPLHRLLSIIFVTSLLLLTQCTKLTAPHGLNTHPALNSPFTLPADAYLALAKNQTGDEQQALLIMAAGKLIEEGQWQQGTHVLSQINPASPELINQKRILAAKIYMIRQHPNDAITQLAHVQDVNSLALYYQAQFHELLASAYHKTIIVARYGYHSLNYH